MTAGDRRSLSALARLWPFLRPYRARIVLAAIALVLAASGVLAIGQGLRRVIDLGFGAHGGAAFLDRALFGLLAVVAVLAAATYLRFYQVSWLGERVVADLRRAVFARLLEQSPGYFETVRTGEVISRLTNDTTVIESVIGSSASIALRNSLLGLGGLVLLMATSVKLTLFVVCGIPLTVVPILVYGRRVRRLSRASQDRVGAVGAQIDETLHEIRTVQSYGHEALDRAAFDACVEAAFGAARARIRQRALLTALVILLVFGAVGVILWVGGHDVIAGRISAGQLSAFVFYAVVVAGSVGAVSETLGDLQRAAGATERLFEILDTPPDLPEPLQPVAITLPVRGEVRFEQVSFRYPSRPETLAIDRLDLVIAPGETLALVGPSGAGKTTVFQLLQRFYLPEQGRMLVDGVAAEALGGRALRALMAVVPQEPAIFAASVAENVRYGRPQASDGQVRAACAAACALEFIERLPQGMHTWLGERGVRLSGGQRARLAIARALLADRPILLLDEATSSLDAESERLVQQALEALMRGRTTLIIAHRLATVLSADRIVVLDQGRVVEEGRHADLVAQGGLYARLAALQFGVEQGMGRRDPPA
ncbi:MAG: ATP-binding cassette domain-containing protein [Pseudomonadota bacterium]|nr:ATP-binding cassette domain-containing protein [Pseudomonadota bacterium]